jgi:small subunit ribosomal protein S2
VDTNCDPDDADYIIPGNDDAIRSCSLVVRVIANAIEAGKTKVTAEEMAPPAAEAETDQEPAEPAPSEEPAAEEPARASAPEEAQTEPGPEPSAVATAVPPDAAGELPAPEGGEEAR